MRHFIKLFWRPKNQQFWRKPPPLAHNCIEDSADRNVCIKFLDIESCKNPLKTSSNDCD